MTDVKITSLGGYFKMEHVENGINKPVGMFIPLFVFRIYLCAAFIGREEIVLACNDFKIRYAIGDGL